MSLLFAGALVFVLPLPTAAQQTEAQKVIFATPHLENIVVPGTLVYDFRRSGTMEGSLEDKVSVVVTKVREDNRKTFEFDFLSGKNHRAYDGVGPMRGNPLIMLFLEWDVEQMNRLTGGAPPYFRDRIRAAFRDAGNVTPTTFDHDGKSYKGTLVSVLPFENDKNLNRPKFKPFGRKVYEFLFSQSVPGGIYRIRAHTPVDENSDAPLHEESVTFRKFIP